MFGSLSPNVMMWFRVTEGSVDPRRADDRRPALLRGFANGLIDGGSEHGAYTAQVERPHASYSQLALLLAAVCKLAGNRRLLVS